MSTQNPDQTSVSVLTGFFVHYFSTNSDNGHYGPFTALHWEPKTNTILKSCVLKTQQQKSTGCTQ